MLMSVLLMATQQEQLQRSLQLAVAAHKAHDLVTALQHYSEVLAINPSLPAIHNNMAAVRMAQGDQEGAASSWEKAVKLKPDYAEAHYNLAVVLSERGETSSSKAEEHCQLALEHRPEYVQAHHLMGNILASRQQAADATASYARAATLASAAQEERAGASTAPAPFRWDGVAVGHTRRLRLTEGRECVMETLALSPLVLRVSDFLDADECVCPGQTRRAAGWTRRVAGWTRRAAASMRVVTGASASSRWRRRVCWHHSRWATRRRPSGPARLSS